MGKFEEEIRKLVREEVRIAIADAISGIKNEVSNSMTNVIRNANQSITRVAGNWGHCSSEQEKYDAEMTRHYGHCY